MKMSKETKWYATKPPTTKGGKKVVVTKSIPRRRIKPPVVKRKPAGPTFDVTHYDEQSMVGVLMDYKMAAIIGFLLGECTSDIAGVAYGELMNIPRVDEEHDKVCSSDIEEPGCYCFDDYLGDI